MIPYRYYAMGCMEVFKNAKNYMNAEELFNMVPDRNVLASIPTVTPMAIPMPQQLQEVLED